MNESPAILVKGLSKRFQDSKTFALRDISLQVMPGEIYGFLGPNGAGKTTTIRLLMNFIQPTHGSAAILGRDVVADSVAIKRSVGYLSSDHGTYHKMTGRQFLNYMGELQPAASKTYRQELAHRLQANLRVKLGTLSRGNRQKIGIIQAFMHQPDVLILDEPSSGLDPLMQEVFYELLREAKQRGATVFISSHILSEVQKVCDRIGFIREGRLVRERAIAEMAQEAAQTFDITFAGHTPPMSDFKKINGLKVTAHDEHNITIHIRGKLPPLLALLAKHSVTRMDARQLDLEEMFLSLYQKEELK